MSVSSFFTYFFIFYFPLCIAFYKSPSIPTWIDEAMTLVLFLYTVMRLGKIRQKAVKKEFGAYIMIMLFYAVYSLIMAVNVSESVFLDFQQQVRPYVVFYCTWLLAPQFNKRQRKFILWAMYATIALYLPTAMENAEDVAIGQLCLNCAMMYYLFNPETRRNMMIAIGIATLGLLSMKSKYFGEYIVFVALFYFARQRIKVTSFKAGLYLALLTAVVIFFTWYKFEAYFVSGWEQEGYERMARPESYKTAWKIITSDYIPFGSGLGTFATNAAAVYYSPLYYKYGLDTVWGLSPNVTSFMADAYYPTLAEYGLVGVFLFATFWKRRLLVIQKMPTLKLYKVGMMAFFALALESVADTSYLSGKGMGYFMILGMVLSTAERQRAQVHAALEETSMEQDRQENQDGDNHHIAVT